MAQIAAVQPSRRKGCLPILHKHRGWRECASLDSNVITSQRGSLAERRIVRGRESECERYYEAGTLAPPSWPGR